MLKSYLAEGNAVILEFGRHSAVEGAKPMATQLNEYRETPGAFDTPLSCKYGPDLRYVTRTLPVEFVDKSGDGFVPKQAKTYPKPVLCVSPSCSMKRRSRRRRRDGPVVDALCALTHAPRHIHRRGANPLDNPRLVWRQRHAVAHIDHTAVVHLQALATHHARDAPVRM